MCRWFSFRCASWGFFTAAVVLVVVAGWLAYGNKQRSERANIAGAASSLSVDHPDQDLGESAVGVHSIDYMITNETQTERRILGARGACTLTCCLTPPADLGVVPLAPGQTYRLRCQAQVHREGPFESSLTLFVDDDGAREIHLSVKGIAHKSSEGPVHDPKHATATPATP
jgi:hypothetical protein